MLSLKRLHNVCRARYVHARFAPAVRFALAGISRVFTEEAVEAAAAIDVGFGSVVVLTTNTVYSGRPDTPSTIMVV